MSRKNLNPRTTPTTDTTNAIDDDRHLHVVADALGQQNAPTTEDKVREALAADPGATTATLAMSAGVGRSTAAKILARWGRDGTAIRTAGDGPRNPDTWALTPSDRQTDAPDTEDSQPDTTASDTSDDTETTSEPASDAATTTAAQESATTDTIDEAGSATTADVENNTSPLPNTAPGDPGDSATGTGPSAAESRDDTDTATKDKNRLAKGGLRALVEEYLTDHPDESFGPAKIGKDLGRSGGAVNNALEKLVADGYARKTCEAPKRFAINPDKTEVSATSGDTEPALDT